MLVYQRAGGYMLWAATPTLILSIGDPMLNLHLTPWGSLRTMCGWWKLSFHRCTSYTAVFFSNLAKTRPWVEFHFEHLLQWHVVICMLSLLCIGIYTEYIWLLIVITIMMIIIIPISYKETGSPVLQDSNLVVQKTTSWGRVHIFFISKMAVATARDAEGCCVVGCADLQKRPWTKWWKTNLSFWNGTFSFDMFIQLFGVGMSWCLPLSFMDTGSFNHQDDACHLLST